MGGPVSYTQHERLATFSGALATAGRPDEAERLLAAISDVEGARAWGCAVVSLAAARVDPDRAQRLAEEAADLSFANFVLGPPDAVTTAVQALGCAGARDRAVELFERLLSRRGLTMVECDHVRTATAAGLWPHDPDLAGRLVGEALLGRYGGSVSRRAQHLVVVGPHDSELATSIKQVLHRQYGCADVALEYDDRVLLSLLTATVDPAAARRFIDASVSLYEGRVGPGSRTASAAVVYAALGDYEAAQTIARRKADEEGRSEMFAHVAAYVACIPSDSTDVPLIKDLRNVASLSRRLASLLLPPLSGADLPRA